MFNLNEVQSENTGWKALIPGEKVGVELTSVEFATKDKVPTEDLVFKFKGTMPGNKGSFDFRIFANNFDPNHQFYSEDSVNRTLVQIKHILHTFLPASTVDALKADSWKSFAQKVIALMTSEVCKRTDVIAKVVYDKKDNLSFPLYPDFIMSDLTPDRTLSLNTKINKNTGLPYDRVVKLAAPSTSAMPVDAKAPSPDGLSFSVPPVDDAMPF